MNPRATVKRERRLRSWSQARCEPSNNEYTLLTSVYGIGYEVTENDEQAFGIRHNKCLSHGLKSPKMGNIVGEERLRLGMSKAFALMYERWSSHAVLRREMR